MCHVLKGETRYRSGSWCSSHSVSRCFLNTHPVQDVLPGDSALGGEEERQCELSPLELQEQAEGDRKEAEAPRHAGVLLVPSDSTLQDLDTLGQCLLASPECPLHTGKREEATCPLGLLN